MRYKSMLYYYYNQEMLNKGIEIGYTQYDTNEITPLKLKRAITQCSNYLYSKRTKRESLLKEIAILEENENYQSKNDAIYKISEFDKWIVKACFSIITILTSVLQKLLEDEVGMKYAYILIIILIYSALIDFAKNNMPDVKLSKTDAFYDKNLKNTFKKVIKTMLTEYNELKNMSEFEFEEWFTNQMYAMLTI